MSCKECIDASAIPASELGVGDRLGRWFHRNVCPPCRAYFRGLEATERLVGTLASAPESEPGDDPSAREGDLRAALRARKKDA